VKPELGVLAAERGDAHGAAAPRDRLEVKASPELLDCCGATVAWVQGDPLVQPDAPAGSDHVSSSAGARLTITTELPVHAIPLIIRAPLATTARAGIAGIDD
jgi:hypothetical protein